MTTTIRIMEPVDPEAIFGFCRKMIGIPNEQPFNVTHNEKTGTTTIMSTPGGFNAMLWVEMSPTGEHSCEYHEYCEPEDDCNGYERFFVEIGFDTTYNFQPCCGCLHASYINKVRNEFIQGSWWHVGEWSGTRQHVTAACPTHTTPKPVYS